MDKSLSAHRRRLYRQLEPAEWPHHGLSPLNKGICALIILASLVAILETEPVVTTGYEWLFVGLEAIFVTIFLLEYVARIWAAVEDPKYRHPVWGRLRYAVSIWALIDLAAIAPVALTALGPDAFLLRLFRLLRILRLARLGRFSRALRNLGHAVALRRYELGMSAGLALLLLVFSSAILYIFEGDQQPEAFGSIPRATWWSVVTLTTVGYGDAYPLTVMGRLFAAMTAIAGIGLIAMPTGILAAAFSDVLQRKGAGDGEHEDDE